MKKIYVLYTGSSVIVEKGSVIKLDCHIYNTLEEAEKAKDAIEGTVHALTIQAFAINADALEDFTL